MYRVVFPAAPLRRFIECFWFLRADIAPPGQLEEHIFTDARADIVFSFGNPYLRANAGQPGAPELMRVSNLDAQRRYPVSIVQHGHIDLIGVRFHPGGLAAFLPIPAGELEGLTLGMGDAFGLPGTGLEQQLYDAAPQPPRQLDLLNTFFMGRLHARPEHALVWHVAATIEQHAGNVPISRLSQLYGYSVRTLDRRFQQVLGFSPKFYARIVRFRQALNCLVHHPATAWTELASTYGYYDQPHFVKEFVEFTGSPPEVYRARFQRQDFPSTPNLVQFLQDTPDHLC